MGSARSDHTKQPNGGAARSEGSVAPAVILTGVQGFVSLSTLRLLYSFAAFSRSALKSVSFLTTRHFPPIEKRLLRSSSKRDDVNCRSRPHRGLCPCGTRRSVCRSGSKRFSRPSAPSPSSIKIRFPTMDTSPMGLPRLLTLLSLCASDRQKSDKRKWQSEKNGFTSVHAHRPTQDEPR